jgi:hypothetical protein
MIRPRITPLMLFRRSIFMIVDSKQFMRQFEDGYIFIVCLNHFLKERDPYDYVNLEKLLQTINNSKRG